MNFILKILVLTIKYFQIERINIEAGIEVPINDVAGRVKVRAGMSRKLHLRIISEGTVLHAFRQPKELSNTIVGFPGRHVDGVPMADVEYPSVTVDFATDGNWILAYSREAAVGCGIGAGDGRVSGGCDGGKGGGEEEEEVKEEEEGGHCGVREWESR